ncbi:MAG TPA: MFS transporter [Smithellaceae bacterium]|nr:MFS transporter [Smithellaceae bacterium]
MTNYLSVVVAFSLSVFFVRFDGFIVNVAMPNFVKTFGITVSEGSWIALSYILSQVSAVMIFGKFVERFRLKNMFIAGIGVFTAGSLLCGIAPDFWFLLFFRCLQGLGGSLMLVSAFVAVMYFLPKEKVGWALGIITTAAALGVLCGPVAGGIIVHYFSWPWIFLINVPLGILAMIYSWFVIPGTEEAKHVAGRGFDVAGALISAVALFLLIYSLNRGAEHGWTSFVIFACAGGSVVSFAAFYFWEKRCADPLLDVKLLHNRSFALAIVAMITGMFLLFGGNFIIPFYLTNLGFSPDQIGFLLTIFSLVYIPIAFYAGKLSDRIPAGTIVGRAMILAAMTALIFVFTLNCGLVWPTVLYLVLLAVSYGFIFSPINHFIMDFTTPEHRGSVSAIFNTAMNICMALGVALFETAYSEFVDPVAGNRAAFAIGVVSCAFSALLLSRLVKKNKAAEG